MDKEVKKLVDYLKKVPAVNEIALFGSRARGHFKPTSDYDIAVFCDPSKEIPKKVYDKIFKFPKELDIKIIDDERYYGDTIWVLDRWSWKHDKFEQGTPISAEILKDLKSLWKRKKG